MRIGIFGGTFDPPHVGHLLAATDAVEALNLDRLHVVPAREQPFKIGRASAAASQRLQMVRLTLGDDAHFEADPIEIDRPGLSFTVDTLTSFAERFSSAERFFLIGEDLVTQIPSWREATRIFTLAQVVALVRGPGGSTAGAEEPASVIGTEVRRITTRRVDISSTEIRERVRTGRSIRGFVTDAVAAYITAANLYRH
jgi:nicotinate-nucleotide adenylyltransferase